MKTESKKTWAALALLTVVTLGVFSQTLGFGYVDYDDPAYVSGNPYVKQGLTAESVHWAWTYASTPEMEEGLREGVTNLWHPVTWMSHMLDVEIWGLDSPGGHHLTSVLLHLGSAILVFFVFARLFGSWWVGIFTALLFAAHPLHVEPVAWLSERKDQLSALFMFASLYAYLRHRDKGAGRYAWWKGVSVVLFCVALCSKPSVVVLPALLVLIDYHRGDLRLAGAGGVSLASLWAAGLEVLRTKWMWMVASVALAGLTLVMQHGGSHAFWIERSSLSGRLLLFFPGLWYYVMRTVVPVDLSFHYRCPGWVMQWWVLVGCAVLSLAVLGWLYRSRKRYPVLWFGILWGLVLLVPVSGLAYVGTSFTADRYMYTALTGVFAALASGLERFSPRMRWSLGGVMVLALAVMSFMQVRHWRDSEALFLHAIEAQPNDSIGYVNLGSLYQRDGNYGKASEYYLKVLEMNRYDYTSWYNLGNCRRNTGDERGAIEAYRKSLEVFPGYNSSRFNLAYLLLNPNSSYHDLDGAVRLLDSIKASGNYRRSKVDMLMNLARELERQR